MFNRVTYLTGDAEIASNLPHIPAKIPFADDVLEFLNAVSKTLMKNVNSKVYSDVVTFAFWIRKASVLKLKERFKNNDICLGRGLAFHVAPSNVPVNFAYSLVAGLLCGNANVVRIPTKDYPQVKIIVDAINIVLETYQDLKPYIILVRYERDKDINDLFSSIADVRVVWGGDRTIEELRKSPLPPRSGEITFADRYSIAIIDSDSYMVNNDKLKVAEDFYNDTFFSDQNACTSPRIIVWTGNQIDNAMSSFWENEHDLVQKKYSYQAIQGINKLTNSFLIAVAEPDVKLEPHIDNLIIRMSVSKMSDKLMNYKGNSGFFYEYRCKNIMEISQLCNDKHCQTIAYIGDSNMVMPLIASGVKGIDRVVPMGKTMDFDLIWDGYNLFTALTRTIVIS